MPDKVKIAVIGCGAMSQGVHLPNIIRHSEIELRWCCDVNEDTLKTVAEQFQPEKVTTDAKKIARDKNCDAVLIATSHSVRLPLIRMFARKGKGIYLEKPMATGFRELKQILKIARDTRVPFTVGHNRRKSPAVLEALRIYRKHIASGKSPRWRWDRNPGQRPELPEAARTMMLLRLNDDWWSWKLWALKEGMILCESPHWVDLAYYFIGEDPVSVSVRGSWLADYIMSIDFSDGSKACVFSAAGGSFGYPKELYEIFTRGAAIVVEQHVEVRVAGVVDEPFRRTFPLALDSHPELTTDGGINDYYNKTMAVQRDAVEKGDNSLFLSLSADKGHYNLLSDFVRAVRGGGAAPCSPEEAAVATAVVFRALESQKKGKAIQIKKSDYTI